MASARTWPSLLSQIVLGVASATFGALFSSFYGSQKHDLDVNLAATAAAAGAAACVRDTGTPGHTPQGTSLPSKSDIELLLTAACAQCSSCSKCESCDIEVKAQTTPLVLPTTLPSSHHSSSTFRETARVLAPFSFPQLYRCKEEPHAPVANAPHMSQSHEDEWLWSTIFEKIPPSEQVNGFFVELGALDGITFSNSIWFEKALGWRGILIEGHPDNSANLVRNSRSDGPRSGAVAFANSICSLTESNNAGTLTFTSSGAAVGAATEVASEAFLRAHHGAEKLGTKPVDCVPLQLLLDTTGVLDIDLLSLDVEGAELLVLKTLDFSVSNIKVVLVELDNHDPVKDQSVRSLLLNAGFVTTPTSPRSACLPGQDCTANEAFVNPKFSARKAARKQPDYYSPGTGMKCT